MSKISRVPMSELREALRTAGTGTTRELCSIALKVKPEDVSPGVTAAASGALCTAAIHHDAWVERAGRTGSGQTDAVIWKWREPVGKAARKVAMRPSAAKVTETPNPAWKDQLKSFVVDPKAAAAAAEPVEKPATAAAKLAASGKFIGAAMQVLAQETVDAVVEVVGNRVTQLELAQHLLVEDIRAVLRSAERLAVERSESTLRRLLREEIRSATTQLRTDLINAFGGVPMPSSQPNERVEPAPKQVPKTFKVLVYRCRAETAVSLNTAFASRGVELVCETDMDSRVTQARLYAKRHWDWVVVSTPRLGHAELQHLTAAAGGESRMTFVDGTGFSAISKAIDDALAKASTEGEAG